MAMTVKNQQPASQPDECLTVSLLQNLVCPADRNPNRRAAGADPAKRNKILEGARIVFSRMGFDAANMNDVTREAGVSKSTIYVYFANKEELFVELIARERDALFGNLRDILDSDLTIEETLRQYGTLLAGKVLSEETIRAQRAVLGFMGRMPDMGRDFYMKGYAEGQSLLGRWLEERVNRGEMQIADIELSVNQFVELCMAGQYRARLFGKKFGNPSPEELRHNVNSAIAMFCRIYNAKS
jgi:AcrR family transcriptional regulator